MIYERILNKVDFKIIYLRSNNNLTKTDFSAGILAFIMHAISSQSCIKSSIKQKKNNDFSHTAQTILNIHIFSLFFFFFD